MRLVEIVELTVRLIIILACSGTVFVFVRVTSSETVRVPNLKVVRVTNLNLICNRSAKKNIECRIVYKFIQSTEKLWKCRFFNGFSVYARYKMQDLIQKQSYLVTNR